MKELLYLLTGQNITKAEKDEMKKKAAEKQEKVIADNQDERISALTTVFSDGYNSKITIIILCFAKGVVAAFKNAVENNNKNAAKNGTVGKLSPEAIINYNKFSKSIDDWLSSIDSYLRDPNDKKLADSCATTSELLVNIFTWINSLDEEEKEGLSEAIFKNYSFDDLKKGLKTFLIGNSFIDTVFELVVGTSSSSSKSIEESAKMIVNRYEVGKDEYSGIYRPEEFAQEVNGKVNALLDTGKQKFGEALTIVLGKLFDKAWNVGSEIPSLSTSLVFSLTGEHSASLFAERARQTAQQSRKLENAVLVNTYRDRAEISENISLIVNDESLRLSMSYTDILDPEITPDIDNIKQLTNMILLQMHLDYVGMGTYLTILSQRDNLINTVLYTRYLGNHIDNDGNNPSPYDSRSVLIMEDVALDYSKKIISRLNSFETERPAI